MTLKITLLVDQQAGSEADDLLSHSAPHPKERLLIQGIRKRIARGNSEGGFTLIELLVVIIIIGILLAIAIPSYLKFRDRANQSAAKANVRASIPGLEAYYADNNTYVGTTLAGIQSSLRRRHQEHHVRHDDGYELLRAVDGRPGHLQQGRPCSGHRHGRLQLGERDKA